MKVLFVSSEAVPYCKTGGLADVSGALPRELRGPGCDIRLILPLYKTAAEAFPGLAPAGAEYAVRLGDDVLEGSFTAAPPESTVPAYFVDCPALYGRDGLYGTRSGDYPDNDRRFIFFCRAALELCRQLDFAPDIIHCHDWQAGLIPAYLRSGYGDGFFSATASVFTIHNIAYQGLFPQASFLCTGLPARFYTMQGLEFWGQMSMIKAGIVYADAVTTVSSQYAREIQTPEYGCGLDGVLRDRQADLSGILNGVDYTEWNPAADPHIARQYGPDTVKAKKECKRDLLAACGLPARLAARPLLGSISRLVDQKGFDLIAAAMDRILDLGACYILLGSGDPTLEERFAGLARRHKGRMRFVNAYDDALAHRIEAGCDIFLMPSRYEPCGLNQIYSLKYGTLPVVRATGGLADTIVEEAAPGRLQNGFSFTDYTPEALVEAVRRALAAYGDRRLWARLMQQAMACDFSWERAAQQYLGLYDATCSRLRRP